MGFIQGPSREGWMADGVNAFSHYDPGAFLLFPDGIVFYCEPRGDGEDRRVRRCTHTEAGFVDVAPNCVWYSVSGNVPAARAAAETAVGRKYSNRSWVARQLRLKRAAVHSTYPSEFVAGVVARACPALPGTCGRLCMERVQRALLPYGSAVEWNTFIVEQAQNEV